MVTPSNAFLDEKGTGEKKQYLVISAGKKFRLFRGAFNCAALRQELLLYRPRGWVWTEFRRPSNWQVFASNPMPGLIVGSNMHRSLVWDDVAEALVDIVGPTRMPYACRIAAVDRDGDSRQVTSSF